MNDATDYREQVRDLLARANALGRGPTQIALAEEAVRVADAHGDRAAGYDARMGLTDAAMYGGRPELAFVSFAWCLAEYDRDPAGRSAVALLYDYKGVVSCVPDVPTITRPQVDALLGDMADRMLGHGSTEYSVQLSRRTVAVGMYDRAAAEAAHARLSRLSPGDLSYCPACRNEMTLEYHAFLGDDEAVVATARPALEGHPGMRCLTVPHRTHASVLFPLLRLGRPAEAAESHRVGYRMIAGRPAEFVYSKAQHLAFLAATGNVTRAGRLFERHLPEAVDTTELSTRFEFLCAARLHLARLLAEKPKAKVKVPDALRADANPSQPAAAVAARLDGQIAELAAAFDARNGNDGYARKAAWYRGQADNGTDYPITGRL